MGTEIRIDLDNPTLAPVYIVNSTNEWVVSPYTVSSVVMGDFLEIKIPLSILNTTRGSSILMSAIAMDDLSQSNIDLSPPGGPWRISIPFGGVSMTEIYAVNDPSEDEHGIYPTNPEMHPYGDPSIDGLMDILRFRIGYNLAGENGATSDTIYFEFKFKELYNPWNGPAGYSHPLMQVYIDQDRISGSGITECDQNAQFLVSEANAWEYMVRSDGWDKWILLPNGTQLTGGMDSNADSVDRVLFYSIPMDAIGQPTLDWAYTIVVGSQDYQKFRQFNSQGSEWQFGGGDDSEWDPNLVDCILPEGMDQEEVLTSYSVADQEYAIIPAVGPGIGFNVDEESPLVNITSPSEGAEFRLEKGETTTTVTLEWNATDNVGIDHTDIFVGGVFIEEVNGTITTYDLVLDEGTHILKLNVYDASENFVQVSVTVVVLPAGGIPGYSELPLILISLLSISIIFMGKKRKISSKGFS